MALTDAKRRTAQPGPKLQKLTDGAGLQLWVQPSGARLWRLANRLGGKQKLLTLGVYPAISLARAGRTREEARRLLARGTTRRSRRSAEHGSISTLSLSARSRTRRSRTSMWRS
jgi:hypothetical protein